VSMILAIYLFSLVRASEMLWPEVVDG
jgi:hypothetical protein